MNQTMVNIQIDNTYSLVNSPITLVVSEPISVGNHSYWQIVSPSRVSLVSLDDNVTVINNNTISCSREGSYSIQVFVDNGFTQIFSLYVFPNLAVINQQNLYQIFNQELPRIYSSNNPYNQADNYAVSCMFNDFYLFMYEAYYNSFSSMGQGDRYNVNLEELYFGSKGALSSAASPAQILKLLKQVKSQTGISYKQLSVFLTKLLYAATGQVCPVSIHQLNANDICHIDIYCTPESWRLGVTGRTELGVTTILGRPANSNIVSYLVFTMCNRLFPCNVKWEINYFSYAQFTTNFMVNEVNPKMYMSNEVNYDAYATVNNNNILNTKGYYKNG